MSTEITNGIELPVFRSIAPDEYKPPLPMIGETDYVIEDVKQVVEDILQKEIEPTPTKLTEATPNPVDYVKRQRPKVKRPQDDPDKYLLQAKALVVANYNEHRDSRRSPTLDTGLVYIVMFTKALDNWKAIIGSSAVRGLLWEVTFNGGRGEDGQPLNEAYIDIYRKLAHVKIPLG